VFFDGTLSHQTWLKQVLALSINFTLVNVIAFLEKLTWILINDVLVSIIIEH
jgi:hypothetical protein